jgi:hypothetical protein
MVAFTPASLHFERLTVPNRRVDQPGWHQLSIEVHHLGGSADQRRDVGIVPDGGNGVSGECYRLPDRSRWIGSVNLAVAENDIRLALLSLTAAGQSPVVSKASNIPKISGRAVIYAFPLSQLDTLAFGITCRRAGDLSPR